MKSDSEAKLWLQLIVENPVGFILWTPMVIIFAAYIVWVIMKWVT